MPWRCLSTCSCFADRIGFIPAAHHSGPLHVLSSRAEAPVRLVRNLGLCSYDGLMGVISRKERIMRVGICLSSVVLSCALFVTGCATALSGGHTLSGGDSLVGAWK